MTNDNFQYLLEKVDAIAKELGGTAVRDTDFCYFVARLTIPSAEYPLIIRHKDKGRLSIDADINTKDAYGNNIFWQDCLPYNERNKSLAISVSAEKDAAKIASDIKRRLIPGADKAYALVSAGLERNNNQFAVDNKAKELFNKEIEALGMKARWLGPHELTADVFGVYAPEFSAYYAGGDIENPKISIEVRCTNVSPRDAALITEILKRNN